MEWSAAFEESLLNDPSTWKGLDSALWVLLAWGIAASCLLLFIAGMVSTTRRRRLRGAVAGSVVEVELEEWRLLGFGSRPVVRSCTRFDPPTAVTCDRACIARGLPGADRGARDAA